jgi:hypothetical protein
MVMWKKMFRRNQEEKKGFCHYQTADGTQCHTLSSFHTHALAHMLPQRQWGPPQAVTSRSSVLPLYVPPSARSGRQRCIQPDNVSGRRTNSLQGRAMVLGNDELAQTMADLLNEQRAKDEPLSLVSGHSPPDLLDLW